MKIEDVEKLAEGFYKALDLDHKYTACERGMKAIASLRAEAWHPSEKAEELGAKDGRQILLWDGNNPFPCWYQGSFYDGKWEAITGSQRFPTHFRFINPPEGA